MTCDKFTTDATFLPELTTQRDRTLQLIDQRQAAFRSRTGQDMGEDNVWLAGRRQEQRALDTIITTLHQTAPADGHSPAVRGGRHRRTLYIRNWPQWTGALQCEVTPTTSGRPPPERARPPGRAPKQRCAR